MKRSELINCEVFDCLNWSHPDAEEAIIVIKKTETYIEVISLSDLAYERLEFNNEYLETFEKIDNKEFLQKTNKKKEFYETRQKETTEVLRKISIIKECAQKNITIHTWKEKRDPNKYCI